MTAGGGPALPLNSNPDGRAGILRVEHMEDPENDNIEIRLLLEAIYMKYGYDFRDYNWASVKRRIKHRYVVSGLNSISEMQHKILYDRDFFDQILFDLTINVTEMFRDPPFYEAVRQIVVPALRELPYIKLWHAGCSSGEEVYSMAILCQEEGLWDKIRIYATDINENVLARAQEGIFPIQRMKQFTANYQRSGGEESFSDYYTADYNSAIMAGSLRKKIVFAGHNLVTDGVFGEMDMIVCRNVLIYFNKTLRNRVLNVFYGSLAEGGFLCLGNKESIMFSEFSECFEEIVPEQRIFRKK